MQQGVGGLTSIVQLGAALALMFVYSRVLALVFLITAIGVSVFLQESIRLWQGGAAKPYPSLLSGNALSIGVNTR